MYIHVCIGISTYIHTQSMSIHPSLLHPASIHTHCDDDLDLQHASQSPRRHSPTADLSNGWHGEGAAGRGGPFWCGPHHTALTTLMVGLGLGAGAYHVRLGAVSCPWLDPSAAKAILDPPWICNCSIARSMAPWLDYPRRPPPRPHSLL